MKPTLPPFTTSASRPWGRLLLGILAAHACAEAPTAQEVPVRAASMPNPGPRPSTTRTDLGPACMPLVSEHQGEMPQASAARDPSLAERELASATGHFGRGDYASASAAYQRAIEADPFLGLGYLGLAETELFDDNDVAAMHAALRRALALLPDNARAHFRFADLSAELGDKPRAERHYRCALELKPDYIEARRHLARQLLTTGRAHEAEAELTRAAKDNPDEIETLMLLADALEAQTKPVEAGRQVEAAARQIKTSAPLFRRAAALYDAGGESAGAQRARAAADAIDPPERERKLRPLPKARKRKG